MKKSFEGTKDFEAMYAAEHWLEANGYSVGTNQRGSPRGIVKGDCIIEKWCNLNAADRKQLDGVMTGQMRCGPVTIEIY